MRRRQRWSVSSVEATSAASPLPKLFADSRGLHRMKGDFGPPFAPCEVVHPWADTCTWNGVDRWHQVFRFVARSFRFPARNVADAAGLTAGLHQSTPAYTSSRPSSCDAKRGCDSAWQLPPFFSLGAATELALPRQSLSLPPSLPDRHFPLLLVPRILRRALPRPRLPPTPLLQPLPRRRARVAREDRHAQELLLVLRVRSPFPPPVLPRIANLRSGPALRHASRSSSRSASVAASWRCTSSLAGSRACGRS